jgi:altronate dehydratase
MIPSPLVQLHPDDNVCVAARKLTKGDRYRLGGQEVELRDDIPQGHKVAWGTFECDDVVRKYGQPIGVATERIAPGTWVHSHNLRQRLATRTYEKSTAVPEAPASLEGYTFQGYRRPSGGVGTRNYLAIISNVNCSATVAKYIAQRFDREALRAYPQIDGVVAFSHGAGCGIQFGGQKHELLNRTMAGIARHPNIGGYLLLGLGCEQAALGYLVESQRLYQIAGSGAELPPLLSMQDLGGTTASIEAGIKLVAELLPRANAVQRETCPASALVLGTNCGGSDGNSGITANPALGHASDLLVAAGGTTVLAETTEIYGAEHLLTARAATPQVADQLLQRIDWWLWYTQVHGVEMDCNPSVGNKAGGLTTIAEKSLGAVSKGGSTALRAVYQYAEPITSKGFVFMDTPGFDPVSVTGLVAGGCNLVVFTTGRGSCFGCKPVPSIKVASNTPMFERLRDDMDLDAGGILQGRSVADVGAEIFTEMLAVASGKPTKSETHGYGDEEFVPWDIGPTL